MRRKNSGACLTAGVISTEVMLSESSRNPLLNRQMYMVAPPSDNTENNVTIIPNVTLYPMKPEAPISFQLDTLSSELPIISLHNTTNEWESSLFVDKINPRFEDDHHVEVEFDVQTDLQTSVFHEGMEDSISCPATERSSSSLRLFSGSTYPKRTGSDASSHPCLANGALHDGNYRRNEGKRSVHGRTDRR